MRQSFRLFNNKCDRDLAECVGMSKPRRCFDSFLSFFFFFLFNLFSTYLFCCCFCFLSDIYFPDNTKKKINIHERFNSFIGFSLHEYEQQEIIVISSKVSSCRRKQRRRRKT